MEEYTGTNTQAIDRYKQICGNSRGNTLVRNKGQASELSLAELVEGDMKNKDAKASPIKNIDIKSQETRMKSIDNFASHDFEQESSEDGIAFQGELNIMSFTTPILKQHKFDCFIGDNLTTHKKQKLIGTNYHR